MTSKSLELVSFEQCDSENRRLREENEQLRRLLAAHGIPVPQSTMNGAPPSQVPEPPPSETKEERARKRVALFQSLFRGREDIYARRWENPDGRHGYSPAALKDWKAINASRPEDRKKIDQATRKFLPLTDAVIESDLLGKETVGIYFS
jgi:hypothetical protein